MEGQLVPLLHRSVYKYYKADLFAALEPASVCYLRRIAPAAKHWLPVVRLSVQKTGKYPPALLEYAKLNMPKEMYDNGSAMTWIACQRAHMRQREPLFFATSPLLGPIPELDILDNAAAADENGQLHWLNGISLALAHQEPGSHWHVERYRASDLLFIGALEQGSCHGSVCLSKIF